MTSTTMRYDLMDSPVGSLLLVADGDALCGVYFEPHRQLENGGAGWERADPDDPVLGRARAQLAAYFAGEATAFALPLGPRGTSFQSRVWMALRDIPYGETISYGELARRLGTPTASRAVGAANGRNPLSIVVPCHRVIGANGALTGFGGGMERKQWLLEHERRVRAQGAGLGPIPRQGQEHA